MNQLAGLASLAQQARRLGAYLPITLARQIAHHGLPEPGVTHWLQAAVLFSDMSGFTRMADELAADGRWGAEELNRILLHFYNAMIGVIHSAGGAVSHFYGDAMLVYFSDQTGEAAYWAATCARRLQQVVDQSFRQVTARRVDGRLSHFHLTMKIGLGYGACLELVVGDPSQTLEFVLAGPAVEQATAAEKQATAGQIIASPAFHRRLGSAAAQFQPLPAAFYTPETWPASALLDWDALPPQAWQRLATTAPAFVPAPLVAWLAADPPPFIAEHRLATSLFVQFEGIDYYAEDCGARLQAYYMWACRTLQRFAPHNGRVNRLLTGDKGNQLHVILGAPMAPPGPDQALRFALALQREQPPFITAQRVGLVCGDVFAGPLGSEQRHEYTIIGDRVNVSARLNQVCPNGEVRLDVQTANRLYHDFEFESLPAVLVKGKPFHVPLCLPLREKVGPARLEARFRQLPVRLVARDQELAEIYARLDAILQHQGALTLLVGPAGVGKSTLVAAAAHYWLGGMGSGFIGACHTELADTPYGPWLAIWRAQFHLTPDLSVADQIQQLMTALAAYGPSYVDQAPLWAEVLGLPLPLPPALAELTSRERQERFFEQVQAVLERVAWRKPLLIILEDLHAAHQTTLDLVDYLLQGNEGLPYGLLATAHRADLPLKGLHDARQHIMLLTPWRAAQARTHLRFLLDDRPIPPELEAYFGLEQTPPRDSWLTPLLLHEAVRELREGGILYQQEGHWLVDPARFDPQHIPDNVQGLLQARLDRLPPAGRRITQLAAVVGEQFDRPTLAALLAQTMPPDQLEQGLRHLQAADIVSVVPGAPTPVYLFRHALLRETAYQSLLFQEREQIHRQVAEALMQRYADNLRPYYPALAYHYSQARAPRPAFRYASAAGHDAYAIFANHEAVHFYDIALAYGAALEAPEVWAALADIWLARGHALMHLGNYTQAVESVWRALALALTHDDALRQGQAYVRLAELASRQGRYQPAYALARQVTHQLAATLPAEWLVMGYVWAGCAAGALGQRQEGLTWLEQAEQLCLAAGLERQRVNVQDTLAYIHFLEGHWPAALVSLQKGVELARRYSTPATLAYLLNNLALVQRMTGQFAPALSALDEALQLSARTSHSGYAGILGIKGGVLAALGRFPEAQACFETALGRLLRTDDAYNRVEVYLLYASEYHAALGDWSATIHCLERAQQLIASDRPSFGEEQARLCLTFGAARLQQGQLAEAEHWLRQAYDQCQQLRLRWWLPGVHYYRGLAAQHRGNPAEATQAWRNAIQSIEQEQGCPEYLPLVYLALAEQPGAVNEGRDYYVAALQAAGRHARYVERRLCLERAGRALVALNLEPWLTWGLEALQQLSALHPEA